MKTPNESANQPNNDNLRIAEYETLRTELLENKRYVFERPLAIMAAAGIAGAQLNGNPHVIVLPLFLIWVLLMNLWFTVNRLWSNARIIAYLNVTIEPINPVQWIGWENSLRQHRQWIKKYEYKDEELEQEIGKFQDENAKPDAMVFYPAVLGLHVVPVFFAVLVSFMLLRGEYGPIATLFCILTVVSALVFLGFAIDLWSPAKMKGLIERQRATWLAVFAQPATASNVESKPT